MLSVDEALGRVLELARPLPAVPTTLGETRGRVLAEAVVSDVDSPPHDKSIVDGYAVIAADVANVPAELVVLEEVTAGAVPTRVVERGAATRIMTGAPVPSGADAVVMVEQTELVGERVRILTTAKAGQNIVRRGASLTRGQTVLQPGKVVRPIEMGLLAEVGRTTVAAIPRPRVAVLVTGNELVAPSVVPGAGQIRNSNSSLLRGLVEQAGGEVSELGIARDDVESLEGAVREGLKCDVLILSGGVSAGVLDLVPGVLKKLGVAEVFHKINLKPGKPLWFGVKGGGDYTVIAPHPRPLSPSTGRGEPAIGQNRELSHSGQRRAEAGNEEDAERGNEGMVGTAHPTGLRREEHDTLVFGLPGNPVSSLVCFELFVRPAIQKLRGLPPTGLRRATAKLISEHPQRGDRPTYWPAVLDGEEVTPLSWKGSGDLRALTEANCLAVFPAGDRTFRAGEEVSVLVMEE